MKATLARLLVLGGLLTAAFGVTACSSSVEVEAEDDEQEIEIKNR